MTHRPHHPPVRLFQSVMAVPHARPRPVEEHLYGCECSTCPPPRLSATAIAARVRAGAVTGSAIAFAIDAHGAWHALSSAAGQLLGLL